MKPAALYKVCHISRIILIQTGSSSNNSFHSVEDSISISTEDFIVSVRDRGN